MNLPPSREGNPLAEPSSAYVVGPPPRRTRANMNPSLHQQVHKVYGEDKGHWFVRCAVGRLSKDSSVTEALDILPGRLPVGVEHCNACFSTRERITLRRAARSLSEPLDTAPQGS